MTEGGINPAEVTLASTGHVWVAPAGTTLPTTPGATPNAAFIDLGYMDENGVSITPSVDTNGVKAWQSAVDVLTILTGVGLTAKFSAIQFSSRMAREYFFGGAWVNDGAGNTTMTFSSNPSLALRAMLVDWTDQNGYLYRLVLARGQFTDRDAVQLQRTENMAFGVTFECLDNSGNLGYLITNNPVILSGS